MVFEYSKNDVILKKYKNGDGEENDNNNFFSGTFDQLLVIGKNILYTNQVTPGTGIGPELIFWHHLGIGASFCPQY